MLSAAIQAAEEVGYTRMTVAQVITRAKVSRKTFYDVFIDREDCFWPPSTKRSLAPGAA